MGKRDSAGVPFRVALLGWPWCLPIVPRPPLRYESSRILNSLACLRRAALACVRNLTIVLTTREVHRQEVCIEKLIFFCLIAGVVFACARFGPGVSFCSSACGGQK